MSLTDEAMNSHVYSYYRSKYSYSPTTGLLTRISGSCSGNIASSTDAKGYVMAFVGGKNIRAHRLIWMMHYSIEPPKIIDHANGVKNDNRIENLRSATDKQNQANSKGCNGVTGFKGVVKDKRKFRANIFCGSRRVWSSVFDSAKDAAIAYDNKAKEVFGEYAKTNF